MIYYVMIERDEDGFFVGEVPQLRGCYSQRGDVDESTENIKEVIELRWKTSRSIPCLNYRY